jgi:hypothetical protein
MVWDASTGEALASLDEMGTNARSCSITPDLSQIAVATAMEASSYGAVVYNTPLKPKTIEKTVKK